MFARIEAAEHEGLVYVLILQLAIEVAGVDESCCRQNDQEEQKPAWVGHIEEPRPDRSLPHCNRGTLISRGLARKASKKRNAQGTIPGVLIWKLTAQNYYPMCLFRACAIASFGR